MHLSDSFMPLIAYVSMFRQGVAKRQPPFEQVRADVNRLLGESEEASRKGGFSPEDYDQGRFAICAWVDEMILGSDWTQKAAWQREQLQRIFYNTSDAGVSVFDRLNNLGFHQREVREVYYLCLCLGFKGRFINQGDEFMIEQLKTSNLKILLGSSVGMPALDRMELFPASYPNQPAAPAPAAGVSKFSPVMIAGMAGPPVLFLLLYLVFYFSLSSIAGKFF